MIYTANTMKGREMGRINFDTATKKNRLMSILPGGKELQTYLAPGYEW